MGLVCRVVEEIGIPTVCLSTGRDLSAQVKAPRTLFVNFPMGNAFGAPFDVDMQTRILRDCLSMAENETEPGALRDLPYIWSQKFGYAPGQSGM